VAGEGYFSIARRGQNFVRDGTPRLRFIFGLTMADRDRALVEALGEFLGCGGFYMHPPGKPGHLPTYSLRIDREGDHERCTIPFAERFLPRESEKFRVFVAWRDKFRRYRDVRPSQYGRGPSTCSEPDCELPVRGQGLCRKHYYRVTGY
jgi:hypothetical protein